MSGWLRSFTPKTQLTRAACGTEGHSWATVESDGHEYTQACELCGKTTRSRPVTRSAGCIGRTHTMTASTKDGIYRDVCTRCGWTSPVMSLGDAHNLRPDLADDKRRVVR